MSVILDTSAALAWYLEDEAPDASEALLLRVTEFGAVVPAIWRLEVANALQTATRRRRITSEIRDLCLANFDRLDIRTDPETDAHAWTATLGLAERHGLSVYDAAYLELAQRRRLPLATRDAALARAAEASSVALFA